MHTAASKVRVGDQVLSLSGSYETVTEIILHGTNTVQFVYERASECMGPSLRVEVKPAMDAKHEPQ